MRLDPEHVAKLQRTVIRDKGEIGTLLLDQAFMANAFVRLSLWERGLVLDAVLHAAKAKHPTKAQRALLALFLTNEEVSHVK